MSPLVIRSLEAEDIEPISRAFREIGWNKPASQYARYLNEQQEGQRTVLVALLEGQFAGYLTILRESGYRPFARERIPEIADLNVLPGYRRRGIASALMDAAEVWIGERSPLAGIGAGMDADYGAAQRLYVLRGYVPDGRGLMYNGDRVKYGDPVTVDDSLVLYFIKRLERKPCSQTR